MSEFAAKIATLEKRVAELEALVMRFLPAPESEGVLTDKRKAELTIMARQIHARPRPRRATR